MSKICMVCAIAKPLDQFLRRSDPNKCRECLNKYNRDYYRINKAGAKKRAKNYRKTLHGRTTLIINQIRARCKKYGREFSLKPKTISDKLEAGICERSGLPLNTQDVLVFWDNPLGPSIDRVDSDLGYTDDNVQVVCNMYNLGKSKYDEVDFIAMCCAVAEMNRDKPEVIDRLRQLRKQPALQGDIFP